MKYPNDYRLIVPILAFGLLSCNGSLNSSSANSQYAFQISVDPANPLLEEDVYLQVTGEKEDYSSYEWLLKNEQGQNLSHCQSSEKLLSCKMTSAGRISVHVRAKRKNGELAESATNFNVLDPGNLSNQAPRLVADIRDSQGVLVATYSSDSSLNFGSMNVVQGNYQLDLSRSADDKDAFGQIRFEMNFNGGGWNPVPVISNLSFPTADIYSIDIRAKDTSDQVTTQHISAYITCDPQVVPVLDLSSTSIEVQPTAIYNYFDYSVSGIAGGTGEYQVLWDFNGDRIYDSNWAVPAVVRAYTLYAGSRDIKVKVWDTSCNYFEAKTQAINFDIPMRDTSGSLQDPSYYYLQADIRPHPGSKLELNHLQNVDFSANYYFDDPEEKIRVICDYNKVGIPGGEQTGSPDAYLWIRGWNRYQRSYDPKSHGILMKIEDIHDNSGMVEPGQVQIDTSQARISYTSYYTDGGTDQAQAMDYRKVGNCALELQVENIGQVSGACSQNPESAYAVRIEGTFHCPHLRSIGPLQQNLKVGENFGAFYCEVAEVDACVGGGGGGGEPPEPI